MKDKLFFDNQVVKSTSYKGMNLSNAKVNYNKGRKVNKLGGVRNKKQKPLFQSLISDVTPYTQKVLDILPQLLDKTFYLSHSQRLGLPDAIHNLSTLLTSERKDLYKSYWSQPRFCSAYLWYFFPWNLIRLTSLLSNLSLPEPKFGTIIMDLGSGPLTLPLALWLSKPSWRNCNIRLICVDTAIQPMNIGLKLFKEIAAQLEEPLVWDIKLMCNTYTQVLKSTNYPIHFIMSGNMFNELKGKTNHLIKSCMEELIMFVGRVLHPNGIALFVEPGTRFGGRLMSTLREVARKDKFTSVAPCTHTDSCPLLNRLNKLWCHVLFDVHAPQWLSNLSQVARLPKTKASFSFQLVKYKKNVSLKIAKDSSSSILIGRVLSEGFPVEGMGQAQYVCTNKGLAIMSYTQGIPSGSTVMCKCLKENQRDTRSGALKVEWISCIENK